MDKKTNRHVSDSELAVLEVLWAHGRLKVAALRELLNRSDRDWAYNTVQTLLTRLQEKGYVACEKEGRAHVFSATVTQDMFLGGRLDELAERLCRGSRTPLMLALVKNQQLSKTDIDELRQMLDELEHGKD